MSFEICYKSNMLFKIKRNILVYFVYFILFCLELLNLYVIVKQSLFLRNKLILNVSIRANINFIFKENKVRAHLVFLNTPSLLQLVLLLSPLLENHFDFNNQDESHHYLYNNQER